VTTEGDTAFDAGALRRVLRKRLSRYNVPHRIVSVTWEQIPMRPSQKVDSRAL
jgi:hypothetical protein